MYNPFYYRNKVHAVFGRNRKGEVIKGIYEANSHKIIDIDKCMIENEKSDEIINDIKGLLKSFKIKTYDEDTGYGLLRHVLIRNGHITGEIMVILVLSSPIFPSKNNFVKAIRKLHPEITTVVLNVNDKKTSMVLGEKEQVIYGSGYIVDRLCGLKFRISSKSFYQVNHAQTEKLYGKAMEFAGLTGKERVIDAYCGIGTIGLIASKQAKEVIGVELNRDAVKDAIANCKMNGVKNARFYCGDAGKFMVDMAKNGEQADVVFMDPPRAGSDEAFLSSVVKLAPEKVVYVSCNPETLVRDLRYLCKKGYRVEKMQGVDLFGWTEHVETVVLMSKVK
jgi:23S rRNA (uracil1939-C5)-methyltransferase